MYQPVQNEPLYLKILEQIKRQILSGSLKVGEQLPAERELAEQFNVSRTVVREAVKALREKGLIEIRPGRGTFIANATPTAARNSFDLWMRLGSVGPVTDLTEVRDILEPEIAALSARRATDAFIKEMQEIVDKMEGTLEDPEAFVEADLDFHLALAESTQNSIIPFLIDSIVDLLREDRKRTGLVPGGLQRGQAHHKEILAAVKRHDPEAARNAMHRHLQQVREDSR